MNPIGSYHLVKDLFKVIAYLLTAEEIITSSRVCKIWNECFDADAVWQVSYKRDFGHHHLTYSRNPKEQYLEGAGIALHCHAKNKEIRYLKSFEGIEGPFKLIGPLVVGCLEGNVVTKNLHNNNLYTCLGRHSCRGTITSLAVHQDDDGIIQVYTGSEKGFLESWNLTCKRWTGTIGRDRNSYAITSLHVTPHYQICMGRSNSSATICDFLGNLLSDLHFQMQSLDHPVLGIRELPSGNDYHLLIGKLGIIQTSGPYFTWCEAKTATSFGWHQRTDSFYCNSEEGEIIHYDFNTKKVETVQKGFPGSNADNQGLIIIGDLLISWRPIGSFWVGSTAIKIWDLTSGQMHLLMTLNVDVPISEMQATAGILVGYSKEAKKFHVWGFAS